MIKNNTDQNISFLPFHAINEFMTDEFRNQVIQLVLKNAADLPDDHRGQLNSAIRKSVSVPGFRQSDKAPAGVKLAPTNKSFEKNPSLVAAIIDCWAELHLELRTNVFLLLKSRNWEVLPLEADRKKLPGFLTLWPAGESFDVIYQEYQKAYPENQSQFNDVALMAVWLSCRLPINFEEEQTNPSPSENPLPDE